VTITLTMGIPAAGKTTAATRRAGVTGARLVTTDRIRTDRRMRRGVWLAHLEAVVSSAIAAGESVIVDACSVQPDQRLRWLRLARRLVVPAGLLIVRCPLRAALDRNVRRVHPVPIPVMHQYADLMRAAELAVPAERWDVIDIVGREAARRG
jgi:predicted kinase